MRTITEYITADTILPRFLPYPYFLLKMDLSHTARLLYGLLLDRSTLSQKNGWQDSEGRTYIVYPVSEITEMLHRHKKRTERAGRCRASGEGTPGLLRTEPSLCENTANASGTVFRPYDCHTAGKPTL